MRRFSSVSRLFQNGSLDSTWLDKKYLPITIKLQLKNNSIRDRLHIHLLNGCKAGVITNEKNNKKLLGKKDDAAASHFIPYLTLIKTLFVDDGDSK